MIMQNTKTIDLIILFQFLIAAKNICDKLKTSGYWADFINPFSGRPYFSPTSLNELYKTDEKFRCMDFQIFEIKNCKIICNENNSQKRFIGKLCLSVEFLTNI